MMPITPSGTRTLRICRPLGRRQPSRTSPTGSGQGGHLAQPGGHAGDAAAVRRSRSRTGAVVPAASARARSVGVGGEHLVRRGRPAGRPRRAAPRPFRRSTPEPSGGPPPEPARPDRPESQWMSPSQVGRPSRVHDLQNGPAPPARLVQPAAGVQLAGRVMCGRGGGRRRGRTGRALGRVDEHHGLLAQLIQCPLPESAAHRHVRESTAAVGFDRDVGVSANMKA